MASPFPRRLYLPSVSTGSPSAGGWTVSERPTIGSTLRPLIVGGLIKKRGLAIFPEEINGKGVNKWKWVDFVMQC